MEHIFYNRWEDLARTLMIGVLAYVFLVGCLRWSGKRTLSKMNAFDFIVTISLGSVLASILLSKSVSLSEGMLALSLLVGLQFVVTWTSVRFRWVRRFVTGEPLLLLDQGEFLPAALQRARVTENEVRAAIRAAGIGHLDRVAAVVLETDGSFSVVQ
ncbi:MAG: YetF domain-containing protein, partial [Polaromonas sp.]